MYDKLIKAYTLIEVLVAISILGLLFAFGFISFRDFSRRQELISVGRSMRADMRLAQEYAISGNKPLSCTGVLAGYYFAVSSTTYQIIASCSGGNVSLPSKTLPADITISFGGSSTLFKVLGQGTSIPYGTNAVYTLTQASTGNTEEIIISASGEIK